MDYRYYCYFVQRWPDGAGSRRQFGLFASFVDAEAWAKARRRIDGKTHAYTVERLEAPEDQI